VDYPSTVEISLLLETDKGNKATISASISLTIPDSRNKRATLPFAVLLLNFGCVNLPDSIPSLIEIKGLGNMFLGDLR
jgi:hypothetical protein